MAKRKKKRARRSGPVRQPVKVEQMQPVHQLAAGIDIGAEEH